MASINATSAGQAAASLPRKPSLARLDSMQAGRRQRIWALFLRYMLLLRRDPSRSIDLFYWPAIDVVIWGFVTLFIIRSGSTMSNFAALLLGAVILWNLFWRCQQDISVSFLDDVWARSIITLFGSPLSVPEFLLAIMLLGIVKLTMTLAFMTLLALLFYSFNLFTLGLSLLPFIANLIVLGWSVGLLTVALILRYGTRVAILAWSLPLLLQPVSSVFYPESVLPAWLRHVAQWVPSNHVFEGMRGVLLNGTFAWDRLALSVLTNILYLAVAGTYFLWTFRVARAKGLLTKIR
jgi:ABC-2 type transport system permease protein